MQVLIFSEVINCEDIDLKIYKATYNSLLKTFKAITHFFLRLKEDRIKSK